MIFGYRAITEFARNKNGRHFQNGCFEYICDRLWEKGTLNV